jgi:glycosyltransferase involved in cell wall biosynthesis
MRILHVITTIEAGGAEKQLAKIVKYQVIGGHQVFVVFLKGQNILEESMADSGVEVISQIANRPILIQLKRMRRIVEQVSPDVTHAHLPRSEVLMSMVGFFRSIALVVSKHNSEIMFPPQRILSRVLAFLVFKKSKGVVCISNGVKKFLINNHELVSSEKVFVVHYGYELSTAKENPRVGKGHPLPGKKVLRVVAISRLVPQKNLFRLIEAILEIKRSGRAVTLHIFGDGYLRDTLIKEVEKLELEREVFFEGVVGNVESLLKNYDVFALVSNYEGFGLAILEALNANLPSVVSELEVTKEILGADYPYFVNHENPKSIAEMLIRASNVDMDEFKRISDDIMDRFVIYQSVQGLQAVYDFAIKH